MSQSISDDVTNVLCDVSTWKKTSKLLDIDFIHGHIHDL